MGPERWAELKAWRVDHRWHPHQLRHNAATHITCLLPVKLAARRRLLQEQAIKNRWSKTRLQLEPKGRFPNTRPKAGRRPRQLNSFADIHPQLSQFAVKWERFRQEMGRLSEQGPLPLTDAVKDHLAAADKAFAGLAKIINRKFSSKARK